MNYQKHYDALIDRARTRTLNGYTETHHVVPRCMGGTDYLGNLVELTPEEHLIAHLLLHKIHIDNDKLLYAAMRMHNRVSNNKEYGFLRRRFSEMQHEKFAGENNPMFGKKHSEDTIEKMRQIKIGKKHSNETKQKHSLRMKGNVPWNKGLVGQDSEETRQKKARPGDLNGMFGKTHTPEAKEKIGEKSKGRKPRLGVKLSEETKNKCSIAAKNRELKECTHCGKIVSPGNYVRWHDDKCKMKDNSNET